jgi:hypothetical protein
MKRQHIIIACILIAFAVLVGWLARISYWDDVEVAMPMRGEARTNRFYAAQRLAEALGARTQLLPALEVMPEADATLYISHWHWNVVAARRGMIERWVESGGTLIIDRSMVGGEQELERWSGIARSQLQLEPSALQGAVERNLCPKLQVEADDAGSAAQRTHYNVCKIDHGSRLTSAKRASFILSDARGMQALRVGIGRGSITAINGNPFVNDDLFDADNALLFVASTQLRRGDRIYFLSQESSESLLSLIWSHGAAVVLLTLALVVLALWRGSLRFGPLAAAPDSARRSLAEQILGTGRFTLRFDGGDALHGAVVRALHEAATQRVPGYASLAGDARAAALAKKVQIDSSTLAAALAKHKRRSAELRSAVELLETARRRILEQK